MHQDQRNDLTAHEAPRPLSRREFLRKLTLATAGSGFLTSVFSGYLLTPSQRAEAGEALVDKLGKLPKRRLGKRMGNMMVTPILICQDNSPELLGPCLAAGMNFIHKAGYWSRRGGLPEELKKLPRESFFTDTTVDNTPDRPDDEEGAYRQVVRELEMTGLKYFDIFRAHYGWHTLAEFNKGSNASYRAFKRLKKEGKVRFFGVSQHARPENYETYATMIQAQIDSGIIDSMQVWLHYGSDAESLAIFEKAHKAGIGITAMKTVAMGGGPMRRDSARQAELKASGQIGRACIRHVLTLKGSDGKPFVDCCVSSLRNFDMFQENVGAIASKVALADGFEFSV